MAFASAGECACSSDSAVSFPEIYYDAYWETRLMNAQAYIGERGRSVRLYGGLGRHRAVGVEGIAFALAHEAGHHLGGPPHHEYYTTISSEERRQRMGGGNRPAALCSDAAIARRYARRRLGATGWRCGTREQYKTARGT